ncbi:MAG: AI-2E family transporter [Balneolales bacterium]
MKNFKPETIFKGIVWLVTITIVLLIMFRFSTLLLYAVLALIVSYILEPFVNRMQATGINRTMAICLVLISLILIMVWLFTTIIPTAAAQMYGLAQQLSVDNITLIAAKVEEELREVIPIISEGFIIENLTAATEHLFAIGDIPQAITNVFGIFANVFWALLVIPFTAFFFLKDGSALRRSALKLVPNRYFETTLTLIHKIETRLGLYFKSVALQSVLITLVSWLLLSIAGLDNALSVGLAVGIANIIPYFGPILGYILSIIVAVFETGDFSLVFLSVMAILVTQVIDNVLLQPMIFSRSADMHPLAILFVIMIGAELAGIFGMLLAVPIAATIKITILQINWSLHNYYVFRGKPTSTDSKQLERTINV